MSSGSYKSDPPYLECIRNFSFISWYQKTSHMSPKTLVLLLLFLVYNPFAHSIYFNFSGFHSNEAATKILYEGDALNIYDDIQLIQDDTVPFLVGRVSFVDHVYLYDSTTQNLSDFSTHFTFTIDRRDPSAYSDGLTFFLAPPNFQLPPNSAAGYLGLCNTSTYNIPSRNRFIAVEFDTWVNQWDPPTQHMGVCINSLSSAAHVDWNSSLHVGDVADARIHYDGRTKNLEVVLTYENYNSSYNLSNVVDLLQFLPERVMIGFTGATGVLTERYTIHSWEFSSTLAIKEPDPTKAPKHIAWVVVLLIVMGILAVGISLSSLLMFVKKRSRQKQAVEEGINFTAMNNDFERGAGPKRFSYEALVLATNNFSNEKKLGAGGFGNVYKGFLIDMDTAVAVKRVSRGSKQGKREYMTEVKVISQLRHRNLVQLIGWCHDQGELLLVYEFMSNGSLDSHLFGKRRPLKWEVRYKIATGLASALFYLHEEWEQCVVHRDIKSSNVMLDSGFNAKLGDFGLARLMDHEMCGQTTAIAGTLGYLAPECVISGRASKESDVYSFGVVALEIACGRKPVEEMEDESMVRLVEWIGELHRNGRILEAADKKLGLEYEVREMECLMMVGLWCAQPDPNLRPSIRQAMRVLNLEEEMPDLPNMTVLMAMNQVPLQAAQSNPPSVTNTCLYMGR